MQSVINFVLEHQIILAVVVTDLLNMIVAFFPKFQSNSIIHFIIQQLAAIIKKKPAE